MREEEGGGRREEGGGRWSEERGGGWEGGRDGEVLARWLAEGEGASMRVAASSSGKVHHMRLRLHPAAGGTWERARCACGEDTAEAGTETAETAETA